MGLKSVVYQIVSKAPPAKYVEFMDYSFLSLSCLKLIHNVILLFTSCIVNLIIVLALFVILIVFAFFTCIF